MGRTIIITERQLREELGIDGSYFDEDNMEHYEFNADVEVFTGGKTSDKKDAKPFTTDELASTLAPNAGMMKNRLNRAIPINCNKKKVKKLQEANDAGKNRTWRMPDNLYSIIQNNAANFNGDKNASGWDRLNYLATTRDIPYDEMRRLKNFFDNHAKDEQEHFNMIGGADTQQWVNNSLKTFSDTTSSSNQYLNDLGVKPLTREYGNGEGHSTEKIQTFNGEVDTI